MAKTNISKVTVRKAMPPLVTHEGARAVRIPAEAQLERSVMACMLNEDTFYEDGVTVKERIASLIPKVKPQVVSDIAVKAREEMHLRHVPLFIVREMVRHETHKPLVRATLARVIQRADEIAEFLAIYWADGKCKIARQIKLGLGDAFSKFNTYQFGKYNRDAKVKLRDVMFMVHPKPTKDREALYKMIADDTLPIPDTWETQLSAGKDKRATFERLMNERILGGMALLRNLRGMKLAGVTKSRIAEYMAVADFRRVLPFRFIAAARAVPDWEDIIEGPMLNAAQELPKLSGKTVLVVDNSGSMYNDKVSAKSDITRADAACALAIMAREVLEDVTVISFSDACAVVPPRRGFALADAIKRATRHTSTQTDDALALAERTAYDRIIVITDEQSHQTIRAPKSEKAYFINVATAKNGIGYGKWTHIDGWSEAVLDYIRIYETYYQTEA